MSPQNPRSDIDPFKRRADFLLDSAGSRAEILLLVSTMIHDLLKRKNDDIIRAETLKQAANFLGADSDELPADLEEARHFGKSLIEIVLYSRRKRGAPAISQAEIDACFQSYPPPADEPETRSAEQFSIIVPPPPAQLCDDFNEALAAALCHRVETVLNFFHRWNPRIRHQSPVPFLLSERFAEQLTSVIKALIVPVMAESRSIAMIATRHNWTGIFTTTFWDLIHREGHRKALNHAWHDAWDRFRPKRVIVKGDDGEKTKLRVGPELRALRALLKSPSYAIPEIRDREIDLILSLISPEFDRDDMEAIWVKLRQIYQQEYEPRKDQAEAREGALRDALIDSLAGDGASAWEFLAILTYWNFPKITDGYLKSFVQNFGTNQSQRQKRIPYLLWYADILKRNDQKTT